jgi:hypothetical protein
MLSLVRGRRDNAAMPLDPTLVRAVEAVLVSAAKSKVPPPNNRPNYLTSYQILDRLEATLRTSLINTHGHPGAGQNRAAAHVIAEHAAAVPGVEIEYFDSVGATFEVAGQNVQPGYQVTALYRLR